MQTYKVLLDMTQEESADLIHFSSSVGAKNILEKEKRAPQQQFYSWSRGDTAYLRRRLLL